MRVTILLLLVAPWICVGCTTMVDVTVDPGEDLSRLHTWNWPPSGESPEIGVDGGPATSRKQRPTPMADIASWFRLI